MNCQYVEPILLLNFRSEEFDILVSESLLHPFITDIAHAKQCNLCPPLLQQDRSNVDFVRFGDPPVVVDKSGYLQDVEGCEVALLRRTRASVQVPAPSHQPGSSRTPDGSS